MPLYVPPDTQTDSSEDWGTIARQIFHRIHTRYPDAVVTEAPDIEFDGNCPMLGITIEAWAVVNATSEIGDNANIAKWIIDGYFFGRYTSFTPENDSGRERGFNLNARAYYSVKILRSKIPGQSFDDSTPYGVLIFRDYDRSPKTFIDNHYM